MLRVALQPGYVLHARPYRETSLLLEVLSLEHGRVGLVARGARGSRGQGQRALLQPARALSLSWQARGELGLLVTAEPASAGPPPRLPGEALATLLYANELLVRLLPRDDPHPELFGRYEALVDGLGRGAVDAWALRCFERDLLEVLGWGLALHEDVDGRPLDPAMHYRYEPEAGAVPILGVRERDGEGISGAALLALGGESRPDAVRLGEIRRLLRAQLLLRLGGREPVAWRMARELRRRGDAAD